MAEVTLKGRVTKGRKVEADAPRDLPEGEVEVVVRVPEQHSLARLKQTLARIAARQSKGRSKEEIDAQLRREREAWDRSTDRNKG